MLSYICKRVLNMNLHCFDQRMYSTSTFSPLKLPSRMETHLWYVLPKEVKSHSLLNQYVDLLSPLEKDHILSIHHDELRKSALLARVLVRTTIARYQLHSQVSPRSLEFKKNAHGKPEIVWQNNGDWHPPSLHFNLSHTSSLIACGVSVDSPIGIDVEEKQRRLKNNILSFAKRYFSCEEVDVLNAISDPEVQRQEFFKLWTLKEAYVKALGRGFSGAPFNTFTIRFGASNPSLEDSATVIVPLENPTTLTTNWQFAQVELAGSHYGAICREINELSRGAPIELIVRKTIPLVKEHCVMG
uniref:4'-phosphopantetheinyl transferase HetI-like n=1 Tax=Erigeron canadensis TaxID=72917 RepID=UPI001CB8E85D|nr:4'-phosphopantetheinyl transferase HetI-like [Erigeron canadensis]XP_043636647.1 4'-phosphopantetheinyl transferase HetI-like [Erigeron canadensis]